jgi:hypothetical protein
MSVLNAVSVRTFESHFTAEVKGDLATWQARFGHANYNAVKEAQKMTRGMIMEDSSERPPCDVCSQGKAQRESDKHGWNGASEPLELVHSDVMGPMEHESFSGDRFVVTFIDDYSRFVALHLMKKKSEVLNCFKIYK